MKSDGLALKIEIGTHEFRGRLPLLPLRFKLWEAYDDVVEAAKVLLPLTDDERLDLQTELEAQLDQRLRAELEREIAPERRTEIEAIREAGVQLHNVDHSISSLRGFELDEDEVAVRVSFDWDLVDEDDLVQVAIAAIGLCWDDEPLEIEADFLRKGKPARGKFLVPGQTAKLFRILDRDVIAFGEHVSHALALRVKASPVELYRAGKAIQEKVTDSIPRSTEVDEAADFSAAGTAPSTGSTSSRG